MKLLEKEIQLKVMFIVFKDCRNTWETIFEKKKLKKAIS